MRLRAAGACCPYKARCRLFDKGESGVPNEGPKLTNDQTLEKLEAIEPGLKSWAASMERGIGSLIEVTSRNRTIDPS